MKRLIALMCVVFIGGTLAGCSDSDSSRSDDPEMNAQVDFTQFVKDEIANTKDDRDAVDINDIEFTFNDQANEEAFDDVLQ
ncbi:hypothetical protein [Marinobacter fonticola]|uniref:hypothetical protein n=1 Tax=Marinobacter fonticola TaxID=2603215 RepID=UPI0011E666A4|nr:hypothetical protein [Marinobacter fonticola]